MEIPDGPAALTAEWLSAALGASIDNFQLTPAGGWRADVFRVALPGRSVMVKLSSTRPGMRERSVDLYVREVRFYRELAEHAVLRVPKCFHADVDEESGLHVLVLEDVGSTLARGADCSVEQAKQAVRAITEFHAQWWGKVPSWAESPPVDAASLSLEHEKAWPEFLRRARHRLPRELWGLGRRLGPLHGRLLRRVFSPQTLIHRDFGTGNMTFDPLCVFDWQALQGGTGAWDIASFLARSLRPEDRRAIEAGVLSEYAHAVPDYSIADLSEDYGYALLLGFAMHVLAIAGLPFDPRMLERDVEVWLPRLCAAVLDSRAHELVP